MHHTDRLTRWVEDAYGMESLLIDGYASISVKLERFVSDKTAMGWN